MIHNVKQREETNKSNDDKKESEKLVDLIHTESFVQSVRFHKDAYSSFNHLPYILNDLKRFCIHGNSPLSVDTTFKVTDKIWLTTSSCENESLVDCNGKHPQSPVNGSFVAMNIPLFVLQEKP